MVPRIFVTGARCEAYGLMPGEVGEMDSTFGCDMTPAEILPKGKADDLRNFHNVRDAIRVFEARRRKPFAVFRGPVANYIGGEIVMSTVNADGVEALVIHQWPMKSAGRSMSAIRGPSARRRGQCQNLGTALIGIHQDRSASGDQKFAWQTVPERGTYV